MLAHLLFESAPLTHIFNKFLLLGKSPKIWKHAVVIPLHKKGSKNAAKNYRPISLTCSTSKVFEKIITKCLKSYFIDNNLFTEYQYGFLNKRSTSSVLLRTLNLWSSMLDKKEFIDCVYFDFCKAFDSISLPK